MTTIKGQIRCPKCRRNRNEYVKANKYVHGFPHVCVECYQAVEAKRIVGSTGLTGEQLTRWIQNV